MNFVPNPLVAETERSLYKDSTYEIVSKVAYLIGVPLHIFENEHEPPKMEIYTALSKDKNARIIRNLCIVRNAIERNFKKISDTMRMDYRGVLSMPEFIPDECIVQLNSDGINFVKKSSVRLAQHIVEINRIISDRINNCKNLFPLWLNWLYIRDLFNMPSGLTEEGTKTAAVTYYENISSYPYQVFINWKPEQLGNILYNDKKFVSMLYEQHDDCFSDFSKVSDVGSKVKGTVYDFIESGEKVVIVVDCENSDPYKLCATLRNLDASYLAKVQKIILFDDVHTTTTWQVLDQFTNIPVEHLLVERVKANKSLVDVQLVARACQEHYVNCVDSFILVSSDSDYWGLIKSLPAAKFLVMVEREACSYDMKNALVQSGIFYCYIDDFYSGNAEEIRYGALFRELYRYIDEHVHMNVNEMMNFALVNARINMTESERKQFFNKHIKPMTISIESDGTVSIELKK